MKRELDENKKTITLDGTEPSQGIFDFIYTDTVLLNEIFFKETIFRGGNDNLDMEEKDKIAKLIFNHEFDTNPEKFKESLDRACSAKHGEYLGEYSLESLREMKVFKVKDYDMGFALKKMKGTEDYSEIAAIHNNSNYRIPGLYLIPAAIELGGKYLRCFGKDLSERIHATYYVETYKNKRKH